MGCLFECLCSCMQSRFVFTFYKLKLEITRRPAGIHYHMVGGRQRSGLSHVWVRRWSLANTSTLCKSKENFQTVESVQKSLGAELVRSNSHDENTTSPTLHHVYSCSLFMDYPLCMNLKIHSSFSHLAEEKLAYELNLYKD